MKKVFLPLFFIAFLQPVTTSAQDSALPPNFLFDDTDIMVSAPEEVSAPTPETNAEEAAAEAVSSARDLLNRQPVKLRQKNFSQFKSNPATTSFAKTAFKTADAPFGLIWGAGIADTRSLGVRLTVAEMKDYPNSFLAQNLPKPIDFFEQIYVVYGDEDELYRILAYSKKITDDASASKILHEYDTYAALLDKKYGNKEQDFTPALINKTVKNAQGRDETVQEPAPIGNPEFLAQLQAETAVLFSTYHNDNIAAALSIGVDGDKKSYIVIDYKNLRILKKQEAEVLDAL